MSEEADKEHYKSVKRFAIADFPERRGKVISWNDGAHTYVFDTFEGNLGTVEMFQPDGQVILVQRGCEHDKISRRIVADLDVDKVNNK